MKTKALVIDIETMANLVWSWSIRSNNGWNATGIEQEWYPICFAAKWLGKKTQYYSLEDYKNYKPSIVRHKDGSTTFRRPDITPLMYDAWKLLNEADHVIGWNSKAFDIKKLNACFVALGFKPYLPVKHIDLMSEKKKVTSSNSNRLDATGEEWGTGRKVEHQGFPLWLKCMEGDKKAQKKMKKYCIQDVDLTARNYDFFLSWITNHPSRAVLEQKPDACPNCANERLTPGPKYHSTKTGRYQYFRCLSCGTAVKARYKEYEQAQDRVKYV